MNPRLINSPRHSLRPYIWDIINSVCAPDLHTTNLQIADCQVIPLPLVECQFFYWYHSLSLTLNAVDVSRTPPRISQAVDNFIQETNGVWHLIIQWEITNTKYSVECCHWPIMAVWWWWMVAANRFLMTATIAVVSCNCKTKKNAINARVSLLQ